MRISRGRTRIWRRVAFVVAAIALVYFMLPLDSHTRLVVRRLFHTPLQRTFSRQQLLATPPPYPVDLATDVVLVIKTGYGTRARLPGTLAFLDGGNRTSTSSVPEGPLFSNILLVGDFVTQQGQHYRCNGEELPMNDVVGMTISLAGPQPKDKEPAPKVGFYHDLQNAILAADEEAAMALSKKFGWELDALKFISSLELAYRRFPDKKWYVLADDDTYLVRPALRQFLGQFHPACEHYLGNGVGGWEGRFAHGGSSIFLSHGALRRLFDGHPAIVTAAHTTALTTGMGDSLLSNTLMKVGLYVAEEHSVLFNGETPETAKIRPDRFCLPVLSFHGLRAPDQTLAVDRVLQTNWTAPTPPLWRDIWSLYGGPSLESLEATPHRVDWDHVGSLDEYTTTARDVQQASDCQVLCEARRDQCMAWRWEQETGECHQSPWVIVGGKAEGKTSGLNLRLVRKLDESCNV
ncbi:hypothetical protein HMPREF1624_05691 [Sporothrix schenckii ATCC 58251]|uniref:N-acetylgalactosaminide beta-1,3-galactosyltransferase n=1 Tax=Sporothrix schenckii (strain ATCC 58251 / de Perez 2211183) TaxID=1391915 RepID=U7PPL0_SPOS1|nr:hypothetical protein HMPREF1624_05691 [Sporothrix schenckii ATCC 58251]